jgi:predicted Zn finger-like uncharacterized protein
MLFTRCPDCDTTFRITDAALKKAGGRVRCGRCASIFDAYAELKEGDDIAGATGALPADHEAVAPSATAARVPSPAPTEAPQALADPRPSESVGEASAAEPVAEVEDAADRKQENGTGPFEAGPAAISPDAIDNVLGTGAPAAEISPDWPGLLRTQQAPRSRWWSAAAALAVIALGLQIANHNRSALAGHPTLGPWVRSAYDELGVRVTPTWDVHQYKILDWTATAEPNARGLGSLEISARIQNLSPRPQPYPSVQLRLKDRWEEAVGRRLFTPNEYLPRAVEHDALMSPGETARASIEVVDPGPDAYGFELDVCIELEPNALSCGNDKVFL